MPEIVIKVYSPTLGDIELSSSETGFIDEGAEKMQVDKLISAAAFKMRRAYGIEKKEGE